MSKNKQIAKILKVLDLPKDSPEQYGWLLSTIREHNACCPADLAFRMRAEAGLSNEWMWALAKVYNYAGKYKLAWHEVDAPTTIMYIWFTAEAKPIHWIAAALIAKILAKETE